MPRKASHPRRAVAVTMTLVIALFVGLPVGADAAKKKGKGGKSKVFAKQQTVNLAIPEAPAMGSVDGDSFHDHRPEEVQGADGRRRERHRHQDDRHWRRAQPASLSPG